MSLEYSLLTAIGNVVTALDTGGPLELAHDAVRSLNLVEEQGANVGCSLR